MNHGSKQHGSEAAQRSWQAHLQVRRNDGRLPAFRPSDHALDSVMENRFTFGKPKAESKGPKVSENGYGVACSSEKHGKDKRQSSKHIYAYSEKVQPCNPETAKPCSKVAVSQSDRESKRFYVTLKDRVTGEERSVPVTLTTNFVRVLCYGKLVEFSLTNRSKGAFLDGRDGKRKPLSFAKSELRRLLGATEGDAAYATLCYMPPRNPATVLPDARVA